MSKLNSRIVDLIHTLGPLTVNDYMALCLFDPHLGYYMSRDPFGRQGDFTTAPEISQMFGELIGAWLLSAYQDLGEPKRPVIAEIGPGRGTLMKDIARTVGKLRPALLASASFRLIETSPRLAEKQAKTLQDAGADFEWHKSIDELPARPLLIVGNELFDAIPIRQYVKTPDGWRERCIDVDTDDNLVFAAGAGSIDETLLPAQAAGAQSGAIFEIAPARSSLMQGICEHIAEHGGAGLFIDYGHLRTGLGDTLQAVLKHGYHDPLANPGEADLTTHVDFSVLAQVVRDAGLQAHTTTQGDFLIRMGLLERAGQLGATGNDDVRQRLIGEVERLAGPEGMGELFKVLAFSSARVLPSGFPD